MLKYNDLKDRPAIVFSVINAVTYEAVLVVDTGGDILYIINRTIKKIAGIYKLPSGRQPYSGTFDPAYTGEDLFNILVKLQNDKDFKESLLCSENAKDKLAKYQSIDRLSRAKRKVLNEIIKVNFLSVWRACSGIDSDKIPKDGIASGITAYFVKNIMLPTIDGSNCLLISNNDTVFVPKANSVLKQDGKIYTYVDIIFKHNGCDIKELEQSDVSTYNVRDNFEDPANKKLTHYYVTNNGINSARLTLELVSIKESACVKFRVLGQLFKFNFVIEH